MLIVDPEALSVLAQQLAESGHSDPIRLRLVADGARFELVPDTHREGDAVYELRGDPVLLVDPKVAEQVGDRVLEMRDAQLALGWQPDDREP